MEIASQLIASDTENLKLCEMLGKFARKMSSSSIDSVRMEPSIQIRDDGGLRWCGTMIALGGGASCYDSDTESNY